MPTWCYSNKIGFAFFITYNIIPFIKLLLQRFISCYFIKYKQPSIHEYSFSVFLFDMFPLGFLSRRRSIELRLGKVGELISKNNVYCKAFMQAETMKFNIISGLSLGIRSFPSLKIREGNL